MLSYRVGVLMHPSWLFARLSLLIGLSAISGSAAAELLGSISDDTAPAAKQETPAGKKTDDRHIIYRVICSPEDQDLPDCDRSLDDGNEAGQAAILPMPDLPPDSEDAGEKPPATAPSSTGKSKAATAKPNRSAKSKKSMKKASSKKPAGKKPTSKQRPRK